MDDHPIPLHDDVNETYDLEEMRALHASIVNNEPAALLEACRSNVDVNARFSDDIEPQHAGMTPLSLAAALNHVELVRVLARFKADVNATFANLHTTALMTSAFHGHVDVVRALLEQGANARAVDLQGSTALGYCFGGSRSQEVVDMLIGAGVDVNRKNMLGMNALLLVAGYGNEELIRTVVAAGADASSTNDFGHSALHLAVVGKRSQIGAATQGQETPLYGLNRRALDQTLKEWAYAHPEIIGGARIDDRELEKIGLFMMSVAEKMADDQDGLTSDDQEAIRRRLDAAYQSRKGSLQSAKGGKKSSAVKDTFLSCGGRKSKQAKSVSSNSAPMDRPGPAPLLNPNMPDEETNVMALCDTFAHITKLFLDSGCKVDIKEKTFGMTALDMAILLGDVESTVLMSVAGGDSDHLMKLFALSDLYTNIAVKPDKKLVKDQITADKHLDVNGSFSDFNVTRKTEEEEDLEQADGYPRGDSGLSPLAVAAKAPDTRTADIIKILIKNGHADVNMVGSGGRSPLGEACRYGNVKMVELLVKEGANIEMQNPAFKNATPVTIAVICKQIPTVEFLIGRGAKIDLRLSDDRTALDKAIESGDMPMIDALLGRADLKKNFFDKTSLTYSLAEKYKRPDRNIESILNEISHNLQMITDKEKEKERGTAVQRQETFNGHYNRFRPVTPESEDTESEGASDEPEQQQPPGNSNRPESDEEEDDENQDVQIPNQASMPTDGKPKKLKTTAVQPPVPQQREQPVPQKRQKKAEPSVPNELSAVAAYPSGAFEPVSAAKPQSNKPAAQPPPTKPKKSKKKDAGVENTPIAPVMVVPVAAGAGEPQPKQKKKPKAALPTPNPAPSSTQPEEEESEEETAPKMMPVARVAKMPPQQVTSSTTKVVKTGNGTTVTKTTITTTVVGSAAIQSIHRAPIAAAGHANHEESSEGEDTGEEGEEEVEDNNIHDVNSNMAKVRIGQKAQDLNHSTETDIQ